MYSYRNEKVFSRFIDYILYLLVSEGIGLRWQRGTQQPLRIWQPLLRLKESSNKHLHRNCQSAFVKMFIALTRTRGANFRTLGNTMGTPIAYTGYLRLSYLAFFPLNCNFRCLFKLQLVDLVFHMRLVK